MALADEINHSIDCLNLTGKLSLGQSASVLQKSSAVLAGDTGLMHIAAAFKKNIVSLWGCTRPTLGMNPWLAGNLSAEIEPMNRKKNPCSKLGNRCRYGWKKKCMHQLEGDAIMVALHRIMDVNQTKP